MTASSSPLIKLRLAQLAAHLVVALIALVVVGGATRVMEAGLACPDWPLCFGSLLPGRQMNIQVFLEWFHRLDAFLVGIAFLAQFWFSWVCRSRLPSWLPWTYLFLVFAVLLQGGLGALTVVHLLPSGVVVAHLAIALVLVASMSALSQYLLADGGYAAPLWWRLSSGGTLLAIFAQCLLGGRMSTAWVAQRCLAQGDSCYWLELHRISAYLVAGCVLLFVFLPILIGGWPRSQWPLLLFLLALVAMQISLGKLTLYLGLAQPVLTIGHQLLAALLVALMSALCFRSPKAFKPRMPEMGDEPSLEPCHG